VTDTILTPAGIQRALDGDRAAAHALMAAILPAIQRRVNAALLRRSAARQGRPIRQEVLDLTQEVMVALFENEGQALRRWDPNGGAALTTWVSRIADHQVASILRSGKRSPFTETPTEAEAFDATSQTPGAHDAMASRQRLQLVLQHLRDELSPLGYALFVDLFVDQREVEEVCASREMTPNAIYVWRNRLKKAALDFLKKLTDPPRVPRMEG